MPTGDPVPDPGSDGLAAAIAELLGRFGGEGMELAEETGIRLNRLLHGFLEAEVLPLAMRAAEHGVDPTPILAVVSGVLRIYADALERPGDPSG
jgi:hypothetical protein